MKTVLGPILFLVVCPAERAMHTLRMNSPEGEILDKLNKCHIYGGHIRSLTSLYQTAQI